MTKRERVEAALERQETDRIPTYDLLLSDAVITHFTGRVAPVGEEGMRLRLEAIAQCLDMTRSAGYGPGEPGDWTDEDGFVHNRERWTGGGLRSRPFHDEAGAQAWLEKAIGRLREPFDAAAHTEAFRAHWDTMRAYLGDDTVVLHGETGTGLDDVRYMLGLEFFSYLSVAAPGMISEYLELYTDRRVKEIHAVADRELSPCALTYGDIACKGRLLHSPAWLRREFLPRLQRLNDAWHEHGIKCLFHSDGYLMEIMDDLIATGIDGLNPIETVAGMDLGEVKRLYGDRLFLTGGIDISQLMALGTVEQVREACQEAIAVASPGYFLGSTTEIDDGAKLENVLAMWEVAGIRKAR
jgi:uroporphyrinogen decarboxylase